jgi:hypothetical protein
MGESREHLDEIITQACGRVEVLLNLGAIPVGKVSEIAIDPSRLSGGRPSDAEGIGLERPYRSERVAERGELADIGPVLDSCGRRSV